MDLMLTIKFSHDYYKLPDSWKNTSALLISATAVDVTSLKKLEPKFIAYDTWIRNDGEEGARFYPLDFKDGIILFLIHKDTGKPFTSIRRHTPQKMQYYQSNLFKDFILIYDDVREGKKEP